MGKYDAAVERKFEAFLLRKKLRYTLQRKIIFQIFLKVSDHVSSEELFLKVRSQDSSVGQVTVYRMLKLLCEAGIAEAVSFEDGVVRYEPISEQHHDHLVCERCGKKIEFTNADIEKLQEEVCSERGFLATSHHMVLYGICPECEAGKDASDK